MHKASFEIRVADFNEEYFALMVTEAPKLSPELARRSFPIAKKDLQRLAAPDLSWAVNSKDEALRAPGSAAGQSVETFGETLFDTLLWNHGDPELKTSWEDFAGRSGAVRSLRLVLANQVPGLPWEALRDPYKLNGSLARRFSVVRHMPTAPPLQPLALEPAPLRMLVVLADPEGDLAKAAALQKERVAIEEALQASSAAGDLCIDFIEPGKGPTLQQLKAAVAGHTYHILHYFGHGHSTGQGQLDFEGARHGETAPVTWEDLHEVLLPTLPSLRLVVLNACELARPAESPVRYTPFTNLAACFLNVGAAMVVAMQYPIRADTATTFTLGFYRHLCAHTFASAAEVEAAAVEGRKAIARMPNAVEWITPVVFTRLQEDAIFYRQTESGGPAEEAGKLFAQEAWVEAAQKVKAILQGAPGSDEGLRLRQQLLDRAAAMIEQLDPRGGEVADLLE